MCANTSRWRSCRRISVFGTVLGALATSGCQHQTLAERRSNERVEKLGRTAELLVKEEQARPEKLKRAFEFIDDELQTDAEQLQHSLDEAGRLLQREFIRWEQNQPVYQREAARILWGKPQDIERIAIELFY